MSPTHPAPAAPPPAYWLVGVDVGGTTVATVLLDETFHAHGELTFPTDLASPDATMLGIVAAIEQTLALGDGARKLAAIGLGIPGQQDPAQGIVRIAVNLHWYDYPLVARLTEHFGVPCVIDNDVRVATLGVYRFDNPAGDKDLAYMSIGTGLATGVDPGRQAAARAARAGRRIRPHHHRPRRPALQLRRARLSGDAGLGDGGRAPRA
jgi:glucokinase